MIFETRSIYLVFFCREKPLIGIVLEHDNLKDLLQKTNSLRNDSNLIHPNAKIIQSYLKCSVDSHFHHIAAKILKILIILMQISTDKQSIVFQEEGSEEEQEIPPESHQRGKPKIGEGSRSVESVLSDGKKNREEQNLKSLEWKEQPFLVQGKEKVPLFELGLGEDQSVKEHPSQLSNEDRTVNLKMDSNKSRELRNNLDPGQGDEKEGDNINRKTNEKFNDIVFALPQEPKTHKIVEKTETKFQSQHMREGMFKQSEPGNEEFNITENNLVSDKTAQKEHFEGIRDSMRNSKNVNSKLPPLNSSPKKQTKTLQNEKILEQQSSVACLDKLQSEVRGPIEKCIREDKNPQIEYLEDEEVSHSSTIPFKKVTQGRKARYIFKRQKSCPYNFYNPQFSLSKKSDSLLLAAKKEWGHFNSHYNISLERQNYNKSSDTYSGFLKGNFSGTCFNLFQSTNNKAQLISTIYYKPQLGCCSSKFRMIQVYIKNDHYAYEELEGAEQGEDIDLKDLYSVGENAALKKIDKIVTKTPQWRQNRKCYVLNFRGKSKLPSVKNMILVDSDNKGEESLLFCKTDYDQFYMQISSPLTSFIAFGIVLTAFDFKLLCE